MARKRAFDLDPGAVDDTEPKPTPKPRIHKSTSVTISAGIEELYTSLGLLVSVVNQRDGEAIVENAARAAEAWDRAAKKNPRVKAALERMLTASTLAEVLAIHMAIAAKIAANHGLMPERMAELITKDAEEHPNGDGEFPFGIDPSSVPREVLEEAFPQLKVNGADAT